MGYLYPIWDIYIQYDVLGDNEIYPINVRKEIDFAVLLWLILLVLKQPSNLVFMSILQCLLYVVVAMTLRREFWHSENRYMV